MLEISAVVASLLILSLLSLLLNIFCIRITIKSTKFNEKPSIAFILNLLFIHVFQALVVYPVYAAKKLTEGFVGTDGSSFVSHCFWKNSFNDLFLISYLISFYGTCLSALNISLDRFLATYLLKRYKLYVSIKNVLRVISITWIYVLLLCGLPFLSKKDNTLDVECAEMKRCAKVMDDSSTYKDVCSIGDDSIRNSIKFFVEKITTTHSGDRIPTECSTFFAKSINLTFPNTAMSPVFKNNTYNHAENKTSNPKCQRWKHSYIPQKEWTIFMVFFNSAMPLLITILCYVYVILRLKKLKPLCKSINDNRNMLKVKEFHKYQCVTRLTLFISFAYTLCWSPSIIYYTVLSVCEKCFPDNWDNSVTEKHLVYIIKYLLFINSLLSPLIYTKQLRDLKRHLSKIRISYPINPLPTIDEGTSNQMATVCYQEKM